MEKHELWFKTEFGKFKLWLWFEMGTCKCEFDLKKELGKFEFWLWIEKGNWKFWTFILIWRGNLANLKFDFDFN